MRQQQDEPGRFSICSRQAAVVLKQVMVNTGGNKRQVPAKRQNRGSRNSTDDGG
ncbi:single-stranded DNA-binding protein [Salmonella enterica subsp. enterica serovar Heidelberg]|uniref:single-stranded DNA-binding protein n=1 Tax=Salmonella enterica TaxID=28901 RepID=UPI00215749D6|nr:single-stranded DNA-binding protein [Salmonella enterica]MDO1021373.1 single-stranded DNA-binding protein [Salmonella enterica subsp. enterica serovar Heidelberg]